MKNKILSRILLLACVISALFSHSLSVYSSNLTSIENIIAGKQDKLIFATIVSVGSRECSVEVMEDVGESANSTSEKETTGEKEESSIIGQEIDIEGLNSYMYYEDFDHRPKKGDNVLLSLAFNGNTYRVKNGAFYVSAASHDTFNFIVPDTIDNTPSAMELTALYRFIGTNGKNADFIIKDSVVYTHDTAKGGVEIRIEAQEGLTFVNEKGETTKEADSGNMDALNKPENTQHKWLFASAIIILGAVAGLLIMKLLIRFEKKTDSK